MAAHTRTHDDWSIVVVDWQDFQSLDIKTVNAPNFADGGTYAPTDPIIVGGAGMEFTTTLTAVGINATSLTATGQVKAEHLWTTDDLQVDDDATVGGDLGVTGVSTLGGGFVANANATVNGNLQVNGTANITGDVGSIDTLTADDIVVVDQLDVGDDLFVTDDATIGGELAVTGGANIGGTVVATGFQTGGSTSTGSLTALTSAVTTRSGSHMTLTGNIQGANVTATSALTGATLVVTSTASIAGQTTVGSLLTAGNIITTNGNITANVGYVQGTHVYADQANGVVSGALLYSYGFHSTLPDTMSSLVETGSGVNQIDTGFCNVTATLAGAAAYTFRLPNVTNPGLEVEIFFADNDGSGEVRIETYGGALVAKWSSISARVNVVERFRYTSGGWRHFGVGGNGTALYSD